MHYNQFLWKHKLEQNFQDQSIFSGKIIPPGTIFTDKMVPDQNFQLSKISVTVLKSDTAWIAKLGSTMRKISLQGLTSKHTLGLVPNRKAQIGTDLC